MRPYGKNKLNPEHISPNGPDVADCQDFLLKGARIRNKKAKRRMRNKTTRQQAMKQVRDE